MRCPASARGPPRPRGEYGFEVVGAKIDTDIGSSTSRRGRGSASLRRDVRAGAGGKSPHIIAYPNVRITRRVLELEDSTRLNPHAREDLALTRCGLRCSNPAQASEPGLVAASPGVGPRHEDLRGDESADARSGEETATSLAELGLRPCHLIRRAHGVASAAMSRSVRPLRARAVLPRPRAPGSTRLRSRRVHCAARSPRQRR